MTFGRSVSRFAISNPVAAAATAAVLLSALTAAPLLIEAISPQTGLVRTFFRQVSFGGPPAEAVTSEINLEFLGEDASLPRQQFSVRWHGFFFVENQQTIEFFAGGNDEVQLRIDGQVLITRNLREGLRTVGRRMELSPGAHELIVDYQQFGGGMALNIQRALQGQPPSPFRPTELFVRHADAHDVRWLSAARGIRRALPYIWVGVFALVIAQFGARWFTRWRTTAAPRTARLYLERVWMIAAPAALAPAVIFLLGPHTIFNNNPGEFAVPFRQVAVPWLLKAAAFNWLILVGAGCVLALVSEGAARLYAALLLAVGLLVWGQGNLWNADYGVLAGRDVDLAEHAARAPFETGAFVVGLLAAAVLFRPAGRIAPFAALAFLGVQLAGALVAGRGSASERAQWIEPPPEIYQFSAARNVIHIVLDEFQSDVFAEILDHDRSSLDKAFSGFVYFSDHAGAFPTTSMSMPAMLTGLEYRNDRPAPEFIRDAFARSSIFEKVSRAGYYVDAISIIPVASFEDWIGTDASPNWPGARFRIRKPFISQHDYREVSARQLLELSLFRHVPHAAKEISVRHDGGFYRPIWMDRGDSPAQIRRHEASNSVAFFEQFTTLMNTGRDKPVYKLLHIGVPHRPIVVDRECRFIGLTDMSRDSYREQSRCAITLVSAFLDRTRALGIYDSSLIIVSSDHGTDLEPKGFHGKSDSLSLMPGPSTSWLPATAGSSKAIMFIKPPHRNGPISISDAPTAHTDLQPTILDILELPGAGPAVSMFKLDRQQTRRRTYGMYDPRQRFPKAYLDRLDLLSIDGRVIDAGSWHVQRSIWNPAARLDARDIDVGPREAHRYLGPGWSFEQRERTDAGEITYARAATPKVILYASLPAQAVDLVLRASSAGGPPPDAVIVSVDGRETAALESDRGGYSDLVIRIPGGAPRPAVSEITLHLQSASPDTPTFKLDRMSIR